MHAMMGVVLLFIVLTFADGKAHKQNTTSTSGLVDFIREAVWGEAQEGGGAYGQTTIPRIDTSSSSPPPPSLSSSSPHFISSVIGGDNRMKAQQLMKEVEVESDGRTFNNQGEPNGACYVGACCGWGHRLMRQVSYLVFYARGFFFF